MSEKLPADDSAQADYEATLAEYRSQIDVLDTQLVEMLACLFMCPSEKVV
jgi:hypothetical protein